ncbi:glycoside hydrolase family 5 protein [Tsukamurella asaccharolytica]|uniref:Glycoside hydrolase family 5 protein n=1 Tax=Tsukamurella asaccharolytica TaxID=2592067 RepID=A0A5C5R806_9ACTN|nr:glycoside hydrolase family 5 protein [Tsukamurella asaccharolytica]
MGAAAAAVPAALIAARAAADPGSGTGAGGTVGPTTPGPTNPGAAPAGPAARWTPERARQWRAQNPWMVGANYINANAGNQFEMFQAQTFDPNRMNLELGWARGLGMTTMRVFLQDQLWAADPAGLVQRLDAFLAIAHNNGIKIMFVLFDSCWDPNPKPGVQREPTPGVHNSTWVQSPGAAGLTNADTAGLQAYATGVVKAFANDPRVVAWDVWNEPENLADSYPLSPPDKVNRVAKLLPQAFAWARAGNPSQPLTSGVWADTRPEIRAIQLEQSDVISFHSYDPPEKFRAMAADLARQGRPMLLTEYMARPQGSTIETILPICKELGIDAYQWGFVAGRSQTYYPWDSWKQPYVGARQPQQWFHDLLWPDGRPYRDAEVATVRRLTART